MVINNLAFTMLECVYIIPTISIGKMVFLFAALQKPVSLFEWGIKLNGSCQHETVHVMRTKTSFDQQVQ